MDIIAEMLETLSKKSNEDINVAYEVLLTKERVQVKHSNYFDICYKNALTRVLFTRLYSSNHVYPFHKVLPGESNE